jgi:hypothetical protein
VTNAVTQRLKAPRTALYEGPQKITFSERNGRLRAIGNVDSQNSFGALIRGQFIVEFQGEEVLTVKFPGQD